MHTPHRPLLGAALLGALLGASAAWAGPPAPPALKPKAQPAAAPVVESPSSIPPPALDASRGREVGLVTESYLSPHQEGDEEEATPSTTPTQFRSTTPSQSRAAREAAGHRGHGQLRFSRDFSRAWVDVRIEGINPATVNMFHIHCGPPGMLGPILVDLGTFGDLKKAFVNNKLTIEIANKDVKFASMYPKALKLPESCPAELGIAGVQVKTIAGMEALARKGALYFNLHTKAHTFYGEMRGQVYPGG